MQYFNIQLASQISGIASATIRAWEKRYKALTPKRAENKHRLYSESDIEKLSLLGKLTDMGQNIGKIAGLDLDELKNIYSSLLNRPYDRNEIIKGHQKIDIHKSIESILFSITQKSPQILIHEIDKLKNALTQRDLAIQFLNPLIIHLRDFMDKNEIPNGQIILIKELLKTCLSNQLTPHISLENETHIIFSPNDELDDLLVFSLGLLYSHYKLPFITLGTRIVAKDLKDSLFGIKSPRFILVSSLYYLDEKNNLDHFMDHLIKINLGPIRLELLIPTLVSQSVKRVTTKLHHTLIDIENDLQK